MDYDVIVAGAGPGGASAACFLGQKGQRVLVLDGFPYPCWRWSIGNSRVRQAMIDVLREQLSYRAFVWQLPLYFLESLVRYLFSRNEA
jgi:flavin-dependent dehydrogenase